MGHGLFRAVYSALFDDPDYQALSPEARLTLLTLRQCSQSGPAAIFRYYPAVVATQTGLSPRQLAAALAELANHPTPDRSWIAYGMAIVWVRNGLRHDPFIRPEANPKHQQTVDKWISGLPHDPIVLSFCDYYKLRYPFERVSIPIREGIERVSIAYPDFAVREKEKEKEKDPPLIPPQGGLFLEWLDLLNRLAHRRYQPVEVNLRPIRARLREGYTLADAERVVRDRIGRWQGDRTTAEWLRPTTVYGAKFANYLADASGEAGGATIWTPPAWMTEEPPQPPGGGV